MSDSKWFYTENGKDKPRVSMQELVDLIHLGEINTKTYVWHKRYCKSWTPIHQVPLIANQLTTKHHNTPIGGRHKIKHSSSSSSSRNKPSIIRSNLNKNSLSNLPNLPSMAKNTSAPQKYTNNHYMNNNRHTANNLSHDTSELHEIVANTAFEQISESDLSEDEHNINNNNNVMTHPNHSKSSHHMAAHTDYGTISNRRPKSKRNKLEAVQGYSRSGSKLTHSINNSLSTTVTAMSMMSNSHNMLEDMEYAQNLSSNVSNGSSYDYNKSRKKRSVYAINDMVEIHDASKGEICDGQIVDMRHKRVAVKYNNKKFPTEWFDINDKRIHRITDRKKQEYTISTPTSEDKISDRVVLPSNTFNTSIKNVKKRHTLGQSTGHQSKKSRSRSKNKAKSYDDNDELLSPVSSPSTKISAKSKSPSTLKIKGRSHKVRNGGDDLIVYRRKSSILSTVNVNEEKLSVVSDRKLLNLEREELAREQEKFYYKKKKYETEVYAVKTEYMEQTKKLKKQYNIYKATCDKLMDDDDVMMDQFDIRYQKLETKEKLLKDSQKTVDKKQKTAQILYQTSTNLLQKVQNATMKMEVYAKLCDEKCDIERELIKKQEIDRKKYLTKMNKLRDEMLSAPWLILSDKLNDTDDPDANKLYDQLLKTYQAIREERRKFLPVQRKWAKLIAKHQVYNHDEKAYLNIRQKLQNMRKYEKEYKLKVFEEMKAMLNGTKMHEKKLELKQQEIILNYRSKMIDDRDRQARNEKKLLRLQQRNLEESIMELEYERELISAQKSKLNSQLNKERLFDISHGVDNAPNADRMTTRGSIDSLQSLDIDQEKKIEEMQQELEEKRIETEELRQKLQAMEHRNDKLQIKLSHFEESIKRENDDKQKHQQSYEKFTMAMETLTKQFEQMVGAKDQEIAKIKESMQEWKNKANELQRQNDEWNKERKKLNNTIEELKKQNEQLISRNEDLEYTIPQLTLQNEQLNEQIQEMILSSDEALKQHQQIGNKKRERCEVNNMNNAFATSVSTDDEEPTVTEHEILKALKTPKSVPVEFNENYNYNKNERQRNPQKRFQKTKETEENMENPKTPNIHLLAINDSHDTDNILSDASINTEENTVTISSIKNQLARSDEKGRLITRHESQNSMTAIVDLVTKTKKHMKMQSQSLNLNLDILADHPLDDNMEDDSNDSNHYEDPDGLLNETSLLSQSADDSFSDHLGAIEDMINGHITATASPLNKSQDPTDDEHKEYVTHDPLGGDSMDSMDDYSSSHHVIKINGDKNRNKGDQYLKHSDPDTADNTDLDSKDKDKLNKFLKTPNDSGDSGHSSVSNLTSDDEEPPLFWNPKELEADNQDMLKKMMTNPNQILDDIMSPTSHLNTHLLENSSLSLSDWDKVSNHSDDHKMKRKTKPTKKRRKSIKSKRKKMKQSLDELPDISDRKKSSKKRRSKTLSKEELLVVRNNENDS